MDRDDDEQVPTPIVQADLAAALEYMVANMRCKEAVKRSSFQIPFIISEGIFIGINGSVCFFLPALTVNRPADAVS